MHCFSSSYIIVYKLTLGLVSDYLLGTFTVYVHVGSSYHTHAYTKNKPT